MSASEGFSLSVARLEMAAAHTADFIARLRALDASGLGTSNDAAAGDPRVARELARLYRAWFATVDVMINDGQLMAEHLAATAHTTARTDRELADEFTMPTGGPASESPLWSDAADRGPQPTEPEPTADELAPLRGHAQGRIEAALNPQPGGGTGAVNDVAPDPTS